MTFLIGKWKWISYVLKAYLFHNLNFVYVVKTFITLNQKSWYKYMSPFSSLSIYVYTRCTRILDLGIMDTLTLPAKVDLKCRDKLELCVKSLKEGPTCREGGDSLVETYMTCFFMHLTNPKPKIPNSWRCWCRLIPILIYLLLRCILFWWCKVMLAGSTQIFLGRNLPRVIFTLVRPCSIPNGLVEL